MSDRDLEAALVEANIMHDTNMKKSQKIDLLLAPPAKKNER